MNIYLFFTYISELYIHSSRTNTSIVDLKVVCKELPFLVEIMLENVIFIIVPKLMNVKTRILKHVKLFMTIMFNTFNALSVYDLTILRFDYWLLSHFGDSSHLFG